YTVTSQMPKLYCGIVGVNRISTIIRFNPINEDSVLFHYEPDNLSAGEQVRYASIQNISILGNDRPRITAIKLWHATIPVVRDVLIHLNTSDGGVGVDLMGVDSGIFENIKIIAHRPFLWNRSVDSNRNNIDQTVFRDIQMQGLSEDHPLIESRCGL